MEFKRELPSPEQVKAEFPVTGEMLAAKAVNDEEIREIILGRSSKFLLIVGPCSADREDAVLEYMGRLRRVQDKVQDKIKMVPRLYSNKPRTTGEGYKGMLHQPNPHGKPDVLQGLIAIRRMHLAVLAETGFSGADEMLYPESYRYLDDCLSYVAVGARSVENQFYRLVVSGLSIPVGMKNPTSGDLSVMMNGILAARHGHTFVYSGWEVESKGNPLVHAVLRGYANRHGQMVPNYYYEDLQALLDFHRRMGLSNPSVIVDCNHANSGKQWEEQPRIAKEVLHSSRHSAEMRKFIKGIMLESYLVDGNQDPEGQIYGQSITDACLGWEKTERLIYELAEQL